jgi:NitT/TauT family transport system substrate-binding protein
VVRVGVVKGTAGHAVFVAKGRGYFDKQGLDAQLVDVSSGAELLPLLASGQLDAGVASPGAALYNAIANNVPLKAVVDLARAAPGTWWGGVVVRPDLLDGGAIKTPADLRGKTIAVTGPGTASYMTTIRLLEANGLTDKDVNIVSMTFPDMVSALASKNIDAAEMSEPALTVGQEQGVLRRWVSNAEINPGEQDVVMMITPGLAANRDVADRFVLALVQAVHDYRAAFGPERKDQEAVVGAMLPLLGTSYTADILRKMAPVAVDPDGLVNGDSIKDQQAWYAAHGFVKNQVNVDTVVDNSYAEHARATLAAQR